MVKRNESIPLRWVLPDGDDSIVINLGEAKHSEHSRRTIDIGNMANIPVDQQSVRDSLYPKAVDGLESKYKMEYRSS